MSFFYLNMDDALYGSIPYIEGENYLYKVKTSPIKYWYDGFNYELDGEKNITTDEEINPNLIEMV